MFSSAIGTKVHTVPSTTRATDGCALHPQQQCRPANSPAGLLATLVSAEHAQRHQPDMRTLVCRENTRFLSKHWQRQLHLFLGVQTHLAAGGRLRWQSVPAATQRGEAAHVFPAVITCYMCSDTRGRWQWLPGIALQPFLAIAVAL